MATKWTRPNNVPFPYVWKRFEGRIVENGRRYKYRVQEVTEELIEDALRHMVRYFLITEALSSSIGVVEDTDSLETLCKLWRSMLEDKMTLVALVEDEQGKGKPKIAGMNILGVAVPNEGKSFQVSGEAVAKIFSILETVENESRVFERHPNISCYLKGLGLSVNPAYQKDNVGYELLIARDDVCKKLDIPLTGTVFTGAASQHLAAKAGYTTIVERDYGYFTAKNGEQLCPRITDKKVKFMEKVYY